MFLLFSCYEHSRYTFFCGHKFAVPFGIYLTVELLGHIVTCGGFPGGVVVKNLPASAGDPRDTDSVPGSGRSLEKETATCSSILPWKIHGQRSLAGYSPWGHKESTLIEHQQNV